MKTYQSSHYIQCRRCGEYVLKAREEFHQSVGCQFVIQQQRAETAAKWAPERRPA